jgi:hypothetical protein
MLLSWNRFWCCTVKIRENSQNIFLTCDFLCVCPRLIQTFISFTLFDLSNRKPSKKSTFVSYSVLTDFCHYLCLPLDRFLFKLFWSQNFWGSCYSCICFICGGFELKSEAKRGWFIIMVPLMLLIQLCWILYEGSFQV